jgi:NitT/TauT family transport system ATP-binding protein
VSSQPHSISFARVGKLFPTRPPVVALDEVSFAVRPGEFVSIIGPSGCGKSTLLRMLAGISYPSSGQVVCNGKQVRALNPEVGFVTQESNLFPWMTLHENVDFPLAARGLPLSERRRRVAEMIELAELTGFEQRFPFELSGGMQKRGALIRTIIYNPSIVLMDEPYGPLDAQTRLLLQHELLNIWSRNQMTILFVTHDLVEAIALSDRVVVMTRRPGSVKAVVDVPLTRPRDVFKIHEQQGFRETYDRLWGLMQSELKVPA